MKKDFDKNQGFLPSALWEHTTFIINELTTWVRWNAWQSTHFLWIQDSIKKRKVVHSTWGKAERWGDLGAHDAFNTYDLPGKKPKFFFSNKFGMRWDVVIELIEELGVEDNKVRVVEVGVFTGHFSKFLLEKFPNLQLIGIDPYFDF